MQDLFFQSPSLFFKADKYETVHGFDFSKWKSKLFMKA